MRSGARQRFRGPLGLLLLSIVLLPARLLQAQVTLSVTSATVTEPGQMTRICVMLDSNGIVVAGTQNELVWDGNCATIEDPRYACQASPGHGKQLNAAFPPGRDFTLRAFLLSLSDVSPINQRELYCCNVRSELTEPGTSCPINITNVGSSSPDGVALRTQSGGSGEIRYAGTAPEPEPVRRGPVGSVRPPSAVGGNLDAGPAAEPAAQPAAPPAAAGGAPAGAGGAPVVLPGGGERAPAPAVPAEAEPANAGVTADASVPVGSTPGSAAAPEPPPGAGVPAARIEQPAVQAAAPEDRAALGAEGAASSVAARPDAAEAPAAPAQEPAATADATAAPTLTPTLVPTKPLQPPAESEPQADESGALPWGAVGLIVIAGAAGVFLWMQRARRSHQRRS